MARLAAQEKLLYYPTPENVTKLIATWFKAEKPYRAFDPCVGEGHALRHFVDALGVENETWGVELSVARAREAGDRIDVVLPSSFFQIKMDPNSVSVVFNNPPYDWSHTIDNKTGKKIRFERLFIAVATKALIHGGGHIMIIPRTQLADENIARHIAGWYEDVVIRKFPGDQYEDFHQVVVMGTKAREYSHPKDSEIQEIACIGAEDYDLDLLPELEQGDQRYRIPKTPEGKHKFTFTPVEPETLSMLAAKASPVGSDEWHRETYVRPPGDPIFPAIQEKIGHIAMEISSGTIGTVHLDDELAKGTIRKVVEEEVEIVLNDRGDYSHGVHTTREKLNTNIALTHTDGRMEMLLGKQEVGEFITENASTIADVLLKRNIPTYDFKPTKQEWETIGKVGMGLPVLPGRKTKGLFQIQKDLAIASARSMRKHGHCILNAEMGFGKTLTSVATLYLMDVWPNLVVCPTHLIYKWQRELTEASIPGKEITAMVISRPTSADGSWFNSVVVPVVEEAEGKVIAKSRFQVAPDGKNDNGRRVKFVVKCLTDNATRLLIDVVKKRFKVRVDEGKILRPTFSLVNDGVEIVMMDRDEYTVYDFFADLDAGHLGKRAVAVIGIDAAKYSSGINKNKPAYKIKMRKVYNRRDHTYRLKKFAMCPTCGHLHPMDDPIPYFCGAVVKKHVFDEGGRIAETKAVNCNGAMFEMSRWRREGLSRLVQHQYTHRFQVYIADECFPGDTPIATPHGNVLIKDICIGDEVLTEKNGEIIARKVTRIIRNTRRGKLLKIVHSNGELICTPNHKIYLNGEFIPAEMLKQGDELTFIEEKNDYQTMPDMWKRISNAQSQKADLPPYLRNQARSTNAWGCGSLPHLRQGVHSNQDQERETENLQHELRCETSGLDRNQRAEAATRPPQTTHPHELHPLRKRVHQLLPSKIQKILHAGLCFAGSRENEQRLGSGSGVAEKSLRSHEVLQSDGRSQHSGKSICQKTRTFFLWRSRREWSVDPTANQPGKCPGMGNGSSYPVQESFLASTRCGHRQPGAENRYRSRWRLSSDQEAEKQGSKKRRAFDPAGLVTDQILELGDRQGFGKVRVVRLEAVSSEEQYVYNLEVEETHRYFARGVLVSNCHKTKGGKTDTGAMDTRLCSNIRYGLALTGTLFGGVASSIFYLLYRRNPEIRKLYTYKDETRWVDHFGLWERTWNERSPKDVGRSWITGQKRWALRSKELPGISPAVIRYLLPIVLFGKITDLGYELPPLIEDVNCMPMTAAQEQQYDDADAVLLAQAKELMITEKDGGAIPTWFTTIRFRPASAFREETAQFIRDEVPMTDGIVMPAVTTVAHPYLPKEEHLAEVVAENVKAGKKTLVFVEQTGTRDIRPRLVEVLNKLVPEANVHTLSAGDMSPAKREAWIRSNADKMDVLLSNPKLVETGLDLVMFSDIRFYELPTSLYTLWQAMRRVWRLGQKYEVTCGFMVYMNTVEHALLSRMGSKLKSAMILYGDEASGAIIESDDTDIEREMIRNALAGKSYKNLIELNEDQSLVKGLFSTGTEKKVIVTDSPMGSPIAQSPSMPILVTQEFKFKEPTQLGMFGTHVPANRMKTQRRKR